MSGPERETPHRLDLKLINYTLKRARHKGVEDLVELCQRALASDDPGQYADEIRQQMKDRT